MKKILITAALTALMAGCSTPVNVEEPEWFTNAAYFEEKNVMYEEMPIYPSNIVMVGDDYIDRGMWDEFFGDTTFKNRGITYDASEHVLYRIGKIAAQKPRKIFVSAGWNDIVHKTPKEQIVENLSSIFRIIRKKAPGSEAYWLNIVDCPGLIAPTQSEVIRYVNDEMQKRSAKGGFEVIDIDGVLSEGIENGSYSWDGGKYLNGAGYEALAKALESHVGREALNKAGDKEYALEISDYYRHRVSLFNSLPAGNLKICMLGNSLNNNAPWSELFPMGYIINRGISGDTTEGVEQRIDELVNDAPTKIFLMTGTNDFVNDSTVQAMDIWKKYEKLIKTIRDRLPEARLYVQSTLPLNPKTRFYLDNNLKITELNRLLYGAANRYGYIYLDIASVLSDENGDLRAEYTTDGIHLSAAGYFIWAAELAKGNRMIPML